MPDPSEPLESGAEPDEELVDEATEAPPEAAPEPEVVPESYLRRWTLVLVLVAVWIPAAAIGLGLYYWWYHDLSLHKTMPVFVVLIFVVVCTIAALVIAMIEGKPAVSAAAIAVMSAPYAATIAAAVLHGLYYCDLPTVKHCFVGLIPY